MPKRPLSGSGRRPPPAADFVSARDGESRSGFGGAGSWGRAGLRALFLGCLLLCIPADAEAGGSAYSFGSNNYGQLGTGDIPYRAAPAEIDGLGGVAVASAGYTHTLILKANGDVYSCGGNGHGQLGLGDTEDRWTPTKIPGLSDISF